MQFLWDERVSTGRKSTNRPAGPELGDAHAQDLPAAGKGSQESAGHATPPGDPTQVQPEPAAEVVEAPIAAPQDSEANPPFWIVGVGASAGGLEAFTQLLRALPADTGMAFVLVQHLAPTRESALAEILSRATSMTVTEATEGAEVEPNRVYVIPPDRNMVLVRGHLQLLTRSTGAKNHPIDQFFRSLAENQRHMAIGVVLSGTATDGTLGLGYIKAEGGITFAQDDTAQQSGMPHSAVASGCVDFVLPTEGIAGEIARIAASPYVAFRAWERGLEDTKPEAPLVKGDLRPILELLRKTTGVDFTEYNTSTLGRRITRRMVLLKQDGLRDYEKYIRQNASEAQALYQDILINVTGFFRDPEMFEVLKAKAIPALIEARSRQEPLRIWVLGCSTGEEAYSLAMILSELLDPASGRVPAQVFATDLSAAGIEHARSGVYSKTRLQGVTPERLRRFFVESNGDYRVTKPLRDMCVFSRHNVLGDPPFSRMDLISCRNLLIYLEPSLQQKVISVLHYSLKANGVLVLGASETVARYSDVFRVVDGKYKVFEKKPGSRRLPPWAGNGGRPVTAGGAGEKSAPSRDPRAAARSQAATAAGKLATETDRLLATFAPAAVLVDAKLEILQFRGNTEPYLTPAQGTASLALLKMVREDLYVPLRALLHRAKKESAPVSEDGLRFKSSAGERTVDLEVLPIKEGDSQEECLLILFKDASPEEGARAEAIRGQRRSKGARAKGEPESPAETIARLEFELASNRLHLLSLIEQHDATNEELQSTNEEAQSVNEELQSLNEELETSKEEIQSSNEELTTVNDELNNRNQELGQLNGDLQNLLVSVQAAIVIVGRDLRIRRFSPLAEQLLNIRPEDVGRRISEIGVGPLISDLDALLTQAIETATPRQREVQGQEGVWYSWRIRPYLTAENKIDGAVLSLLDIDAIRRSRQYAENIVATVREPLLVLDRDLRVRSASRAFYEKFGYTSQEVEGRLLYEVGSGEWDILDLRTLLGHVVDPEIVLNQFAVVSDFRGLGRRIMMLDARTLREPEGNRKSILLSIEDVTDRRRAEAAVALSELRFRRLFESGKDGILMLDAHAANITDANPFICDLLGYTRAELIGKELWQIGLFKDAENSKDAMRELQEKRYIRYDVLPLKTKTGQRVDVEFVSNVYDEGGLQVIQCNIRDITQRRLTEEALRRTREDFRVLFDLGPVAIFACDREGVFQNYNQRAAELWGREPRCGPDGERFGESTGLHYPDGRPFLQENNAIVDALRTGAFAEDEELLIERPDGSRVSIVLSLAPLKDEAGAVTGAIAAFHDVTERKRLEEVLAKRNEELAAADGAKNQFIAVLSHELRSPLNAIRGWIQILRRPDAQAGDVETGLEVIDRNSKAQSQLIDDLLDVHRIAAGKIRLELAPLDLRAVIDAVVDAVSPTAADKQIRIEKVLAAQPVGVSGDAARLQQVLENLLGNALKFTPKGGEIRVVVQRHGGLAQMIVSDTGQGIPADELPHVFERFRQGDPGTSRYQGGLGLGLAISKQLVELHGGTISAHSAGREKGATFTASFPLRAADALDPRALARATVGPQSRTLEGILVLVVDDEPDAREPVRRVLEAAGAEAMAVASAAEALNTIDQRRPDVIVSDIGMPGRDGYELVRSIRALSPGRGGLIPAIALTAYAAAEDRERALSAGFQKHLAKPVDSAVLITAIAALVDRTSSGARRSEAF